MYVVRELAACYRDTTLRCRGHQILAYVCSQEADVILHIHLYKAAHYFPYRHMKYPNLNRYKGWPVYMGTSSFFKLGPRGSRGVRKITPKVCKFAQNSNFQD